MSRRRYIAQVAEDGTVRDPRTHEEPRPVAAPPGAFVLVDHDTVDVIAHPGTALADTYALALSHELDPTLPDGVEAEAQAWVRSPGIDDPSLEDLTALPFVTIDEQTSKDLDQAVAVARDEDGYVVWYAIADAAHFVRPGMLLFDEALARGATAYLPGLVVPMLPRVLSEGIISLNAGEDRRAVVFRLALDARGVCVATTMHRARVRVRTKTWFDAVQAFFDGASAPSDDPAVATSLELLREVGEKRLELAEERSMVAYRRAELVVKAPDDDGPRFVALRDLRNDVERYNEQISVLANVEGAKILRDAASNPDVHAIYRVHEPPREEALADLRSLIAGLARTHDLDRDTWMWDPDTTPLARWLEALPHNRIAQAVHRQALLANRRSTFQVEPQGHHGVGAPVYGRFTAPMREIVGVFLHKELAEALGWIAPAPRRDDEATRAAVIDASHRARALQRDLDREANRMVLDQLFEAHPGPYEGTVVGLSRDKLHVLLDDPPIDVKVYHRHLEDQLGFAVHTDPSRVAVRDRDGEPVVRVGDGVRVEVVGRDEKRDRWRLTVEVS